MVRKIALILISLGMVLVALSQNRCNDTIAVFGSPIKDFPIFRKDAPTGLVDFFMGNIHYPKAAEEDGIEGKVTIRFWIDSNGHVSDYELSEVSERI